MLSRYGRGASFSRHVDADAGDGRILSAILYTSREWRPADGGCLRIHAPCAAPDGAGRDGSCRSSSPPTGAPQESSARHPAGGADDDAVADVAPLAGRLLLFLADGRCPHEVLPVCSDEPRYALTLWYLGTGCS